MFTLFQKIAAISSSTSSSASQKAALIFLHGLGDTPAGWSSLQFSLPQLQPRLSQLEFVFPPAPIIPISINGGATMPGWCVWVLCAFLWFLRDASL